MSHLDIYTDGSPGPNKGPWCGWGAAAYIGGVMTRRACGIGKGKETTNAMELEGMIRGIGFAADSAMQSTVWVDSQYAANSWSKIVLLHHAGWRVKGKLIPNADKLEFLYDLLHEFGYASLVTVRWLRGHQGVEGNEEADRLSKLAAYKGEQWDETL